MIEFYREFNTELKNGVKTGESKAITRENVDFIQKKKLSLNKI